MKVLHVYLTLSRDRGDASRERLVVDHARADAMEGASVQVITNAPIAPMTGVVVSLVDSAGLPPAPNESAEFARENVLGFAKALETGHASVERVVAHGWASLPAASRLAQRTKARLVLVAHANALEAGGAASTLASEQLDWARRTGVEIVDASSFGEDRAFDVALGDGAPWDLAEYVTTRFPRNVVVKGLAPDEQARSLARAEVVLIAPGALRAAETANAALAAGSLPVLLGSDVPGLGSKSFPRVADGRALEALLDRFLGNRVSRACMLSKIKGELVRERNQRQHAPDRSLTIVLNHGGLVVKDLAESVGPLGWEVRSLTEGGDLLPEADFLVVLPYGDPKGALAAVHRARTLGVPAVFWNVEDPRYFFDEELGPLVRDMARESSVVFSTTLQLEREYRDLGVELLYLPVYGRGYFLAETASRARPIDLLFLGTMTVERRAFLDELRALLPGVKLVARDDVREPRSLMDLVSKAKLGLSCGTLTDAVTPAGLLRSQGITERVFDYPLAGTPVLSDERGHLAELLVPGEEVFVFHDAGNAARQIRTLLADPARRDAVASRARERVLTQHLGRHRMLTVAETHLARGLLGDDGDATVARGRELSLAADAALTRPLVSVAS